MSDDGTDTTITLDDGSQMILKSVLVSELSAANFTFGSAVCYCPGTLIQTASGAVLVENLRVGDLLLTADNGPQPIRWIGITRHALEPGPNKEKPIEFKPGSLGKEHPNEP